MARDSYSRNPVVAAAMGVLAGAFVAKHVDVRLVSIAGTGFIAIGAWTLIAALRG